MPRARGPGRPLCRRWYSSRVPCDGSRVPCGSQSERLRTGAWEPGAGWACRCERFPGGGPAGCPVPCAPHTEGWACRRERSSRTRVSRGCGCPSPPLPCPRPWICPIPGEHLFPRCHRPHGGRGGGQPSLLPGGRGELLVPFLRFPGCSEDRGAGVILCCSFSPHPTIHPTFGRWGFRVPHGCGGFQGQPDPTGLSLRG